MLIESDKIAFLSFVTWSLVNLIRLHLWKSLDGVLVLFIAAIVSVILSYIFKIPLESSIIGTILAHGIQQGYKAIRISTKDDLPISDIEKAKENIENKIEHISEQIEFYKREATELQERLSDLERRLRF